MKKLYPAIILIAILLTSLNLVGCKTGNRQNLKAEVAKLQQQNDEMQKTIEQLNAQIKEKAEEQINSKLYGIVFTTGYDEKTKLPYDDLKEISINEERLYIYCKWRLTLKDHSYALKITNDSQGIIYEQTYDLKPTQLTWITWPWISINPYVDKPGLWKVEVYLDGRKVGQRSINVLPEA